jgi:phage-related protein
MFYAKTFIFDDVPSEFYGLYLGGLGDSGEAITITSSDVTLLTQKLFRRPLPLFWGAEQTPVNQFQLSIYSPSEITTQHFSEVSSWLFGQMEYKTLRICQCDMMDIYFNCFLTLPQIIRVGNIIRGMTCTVVCDSPWAWREPKVYTYGYGDYVVNDTVHLLNESANNAYTYPSNVTIHGGVMGGYATITNSDDASRQFIYNLARNETVSIDCENQILVSDIVTYPISSFNLNFLRFLRGYNTLAISGNIISLSITSPRAVKIGG